ncbi:MAG TPA: protein kinase, partial [Pseudomonadota bacterium]|nr:protein kinase [Pseudomonadota bacterium]
MGALYLCCVGDRGLEKLCVIKTVLPHLADPEYVARFRDEAKVVVKLSHGNLVPVFDAGLVQDELYLAMDYIEGKDLRAVWNRCAKKGIAFPIDVAVYIARELSRGLHYAHNFGGIKLVHRDVSPPNVLVGFSGEVKLTDFGLASSTLKLEKTAAGIIYGKVSYMSPEQARGELIDGRTDIYAAGIILWELLTGRQLFPQNQSDGTELIERVRNPVIDPPSVRAPRVPASLDQIVLRALARNPDERYLTGEQFRAELTAFLASNRDYVATDAERVRAFMKDLFDEDIERERRQRDELLETVHEKLQENQRLELAEREAAEQRQQRKADIMAAIERKSSDGLPAVDAGQLREGEIPGQVMEQLSAYDTAKMLGSIIERWKILRKIGEGGMGRVFEAEHTEIGRRVAIKILHPVYSRTPEVVARFRMEARAASRIGHPNIIEITDSGTTIDGSFYFVMEMLEGIDLAERLKKEQRLPVEDMLIVATQVAQAL